MKFSAAEGKHRATGKMLSADPGTWRESARAAAAQGLTSLFAAADLFRCAQAQALSALGFGPAECAYRIAAAGDFWRVREYLGKGRGAPLLIVATPIKKPYLWDLVPRLSAVRACLKEGKRVFVLEWLPPLASASPAGLAGYAGKPIADAIASVRRATGEAKLFLMGHSLGGTLAAIGAALQPRLLHGLVLLAAPLCFSPGSSRFRDSLARLAPGSFPAVDVIPGSLLSQVSALASPQTFIWSRLRDAALETGDWAALEIHTRVERWALDEAPLPGPLVRDILKLLYRENCLCRGTLPIEGETVGPSRLRVPTLAIVNTADDIAPRASVAPFLEAAATKDTRLIEHAAETGVGLQHLSALVGRQAHARIWPEILAWIDAHEAS